jgi:Holliday junction resolvase RusA-like endonuclease
MAGPQVITLDLPVPYSVNQTRRVNWAYIKRHKEWTADADALVMLEGQQKQKPIVGQFQALIILDETKCKADPDNIIKALFDYCRRLRLIENDSPKYLRKFTVEYGEAPEGVRITLKPLQ